MLKVITKIISLMALVFIFCLHVGFWPIGLLVVIAISISLFAVNYMSIEGQNFEHTKKNYAISTGMATFFLIAALLSGVCEYIIVG